MNREHVEKIKEEMRAHYIPATEFMEKMEALTEAELRLLYKMSYVQYRQQIRRYLKANYPR